MIYFIALFYHKGKLSQILSVFVIKSDPEFRLEECRNDQNSYGGNHDAYD